MGDAREIVIRPPAPAEKRACRMLLPRATEAGQRSRVFVALSGQPPRVVGAAAMGIDPQHAGQRWLVDVHVIPPFRRRGIGRALLRRLIDEAQTLGIASLRAWDWVALDSEDARAWAGLGLLRCQRRLDYQIDMKQALAMLSPLLERVRTRIPAGARVIPLAEADLKAVIRLHEQYLGGNARVLLPLLDGTASNAYDRRLSSVLLLDGAVVGIALGRTFGDGSCEVDSRALHPVVRRRWPNVWLLHEGLRRGIDAGLRTMRYFTLDEHEDTRQLSERFGGELIATSVRMGLELRRAEASPGTSPGRSPGGETIDAEG
jgi:GNAT superfamily N-acetyltransferase